MRIFLKLARVISGILALVGAVAVVLAMLLFDFMHRSKIDNALENLPGTAIVFTGQYDRIRVGLELLSEGRADRLFITGVNKKAGLDIAGFASQFGLSAEQAAWIENGRIVLAPSARSTLENAWETGCWLEDQPSVDAVMLITSRRHMARASIALQHEIAPVDVVRLFSDPQEPHDPLQLDLVELGEFIATWGITLLPHEFWPADEPALCAVR